MQTNQNVVKKLILKMLDRQDMDNRLSDDILRKLPVESDNIMADVKEIAKNIEPSLFNNYQYPKLPHKMARFVDDELHNAIVDAMREKYGKPFDPYPAIDEYGYPALPF